MFERTNFLTCATGLQGNVQILLQNCLHKSVQIFLSVSIEFFLFLPRRVTGSRIVSGKLQKTYLVQLLTRVRVKVPPYRWTLTYFLSGQKLAEFVVQKFARLRGSRKNERRTRASFCPFKKVS